MKIKAITFSRDLLRKGIEKKDFLAIINYLPDDCKIVGFYETWEIPICGIVVESNEYEIVKEGNQTPQIILMLTRDNKGNLKITPYY